MEFGRPVRLGNGRSAGVALDVVGVAVTDAGEVVGVELASAGALPMMVVSASAPSAAAVVVVDETLEKRWGRFAYRISNPGAAQASFLAVPAAPPSATTRARLPRASAGAS